MKPYLNRKKIVNWYLKNSPNIYLLSKLNHGQKIDENTTYDVSWIDEYDGMEVSVDERDEKILHLLLKEKNRLGDGYESIISLRIYQPRKNAWITWR
jgi:hypothetical protein